MGNVAHFLCMIIQYHQILIAKLNIFTFLDWYCPKNKCKMKLWFEQTAWFLSQELQQLVIVGTRTLLLILKVGVGFSRNLEVPLIN